MNKGVYGKGEAKESGNGQARRGHQQGLVVELLKCYNSSGPAGDNAAPCQAAPPSALPVRHVLR